MVKKLFDEKGIELIVSAEVVDVEAGSDCEGGEGGSESDSGGLLLCADGRRIGFNEAFWCTQVGVGLLPAESFLVMTMIYMYVYVCVSALGGASRLAGEHRA